MQLKFKARTIPAVILAVLILASACSYRTIEENQGDPVSPVRDLIAALAAQTPEFATDAIDPEVMAAVADSDLFFGCLYTMNSQVLDQSMLEYTVSTEAIDDAGASVRVVFPAYDRRAIWTVHLRRQGDDWYVMEVTTSGVSLFQQCI